MAIKIPKKEIDVTGIELSLSGLEPISLSAINFRVFWRHSP